MPEGSKLLLFLAASLTLISTPGQNNLHVPTCGIAQGRCAAYGMLAGLGARQALA